MAETLPDATPKSTEKAAPNSIAPSATWRPLHRR